MRILQLANKPPWPPVEGGPMAMYAVSSALLNLGFELKILATATPKFNVKREDVPEEFRVRTSFETIFVNTGIKPLQVFLHLFSGKSYIISRFFSRAFCTRLKNVLDEFRPDIVIMESLFMWRYIEIVKQSIPDIKIILRAHNIEHLIWERIAGGTMSKIKKLFVRHLANRLRNEEIKAAASFNGIIAITEVDAGWFRKMVPDIRVISLPFGIEVVEDNESTLPEIPPLRIYHLGSMNWFPNIEAVEWLMRLCDKGFLDRFPQIELHLAGRNMPANLVRYNHERLKVHGEVLDSRTFINDNHVLAAPIFSGSGIRIKIIEAMASGKVVITTTTGAEGINYTNGRDILIADSAEAFYEAVGMLLNDPSLVRSIGSAAKSLIMLHYNPAILAEKLGEFLSGYEDNL